MLICYRHETLNGAVECEYNTETNKYRFESGICKFNLLPDIDRAWVYKMMSLYKRDSSNCISIYLGSPDLADYGSCHVSLLINCSVCSACLYIVWYSLSMHNKLFYCFNKYIIDHRTLITRLEDLYVSMINIRSMSIVKAFVANHEFCIKFLKHLFAQAEKEYIKEA